MGTSGGVDIAGGGRELYFGSLRGITVEQGKVLLGGGADAGHLEWPRVWTGGHPEPRFSERSAVPTQEEAAEDYMSGLVEHVARSMLEEDEQQQQVQQEDEDDEKSVPWALECPKSAWPVTAPEKHSLPGSPQSTLAGIGASTWDFSPSASSGGLSSGVSSPPTPSAPAVEESDALDLLYAELVRLKMEDEKRACQQQQQQFRIQQLQRQQQYRQQLLQLRMRQQQQQQQAAEISSSKPAGYAAVSANYTIPSKSGYYERRSRNEDYTQKQQAVRSRNGSTGSYYAGQNNNPNANGRNWLDMLAAAAPLQQNQQLGAAAAVPVTSPLQVPAAAAQVQGHQPQQQRHHVNGSGMRAVFLGARGSRESGGTGVFLPRRIGSGPDTKRKPACSTVLLPSRIVQALNLNVEDTLAGPMTMLPSPTGTPSTSRRDQAWCRCPHQDRNLIGGGRSSSEAVSHRAQIPSLQEVAPDISLPTEWTY